MDWNVLGWKYHLWPLPTKTTEKEEGEDVITVIQ